MNKEPAPPMNHHNLNYLFQIDSVTFQVSMVSLAKFGGSIPSHAHGKDCFEIHYVISGKGHAIIDGNYYALEENTLYITGPHVLHEQIPFDPDPMAEYCIYLRVVSDASGKIPFASIPHQFIQTPFWVGTDSQNIHLVFQMIIHELEEKGLGHQTLVAALFEQLIVSLVRNYKKDSCNGISEKTATGGSIFLTIEEAFLNEYKTLSLEQLAQKINLSNRQTERLLREHYNSNFQKKRTEARMYAASILLKTSPYSIATISEMVGYSSSEHFALAFKKHFGTSALKYRKLHLSLKPD